MDQSVHFSSENPNWKTPPEVFWPLFVEFQFTVDVAASDGDLMPRYFSKEMDGLKQDWRGERVWCNPPYGRGMGAWIEKLATGGANLAVGLIPSRTDTKWFHDYCLGKAEIRFLRGRIKFVGAKHAAPFPSMVVIWR